MLTTHEEGKAYYQSRDRERGFWHRLWNLVRKLFSA